MCEDRTNGTEILAILSLEDGFVGDHLFMLTVVSLLSSLGC